jgi:positive regulator of sigma E activity
MNVLGTTTAILLAVAGFAVASTFARRADAQQPSAPPLVRQLEHFMC